MQAENGVLVYKKDSWEVIRSHVTIEKFLGGGSFGDVYQGFIKDVGSQAQRPCAIKMVKQAATKEDKTEFLNEANIMKAFDANHVVKLLGVVSVGEPTMILMELMPRGSLLNYLDSCRLKSKSPTQERILQMSAEIADGMAYLADKKYVHRDLAARNCMVADDLTVKVGDFGLTRHIYEKDYYRIGPNGPNPIRWMAPESLRHGVFTSSSDVWSYGVLLWEMATGGMTPYFAKFRNDEVLNFVEEGGTLDRPDNCPDWLYSLMHRCWAFNPEDRPTFMEILAYLEPYTNPNFPKVSYYHSDAAKENNKIRKSSKAALSSKAASDALENINLFRHVLPALM
uniref:Insulin-like receptor n=2 Tax=Cacopsylla melanoneura TaxID=428564 RepID=A0A8D8PNT9_9HEMI